MSKQKSKTKKQIQEEVNEFLNEKDINLNNYEIKEIKFKNENQKKLSNSIRKNDLTVAIGEAGCGKTIVACYQALKLLKSNEKYEKILLIKSVTELKGENIGLLPGTKDEKMLVFMMSYLDSFYKLIGESKTKMLIEKGVIVFEPVAFTRGRNFENSIVLLDEAQNITKDNLKTLLTRMSEDSKYIILGDTEQIDLKQKYDSSLEFIYNKVANNPTEGVEAIKFSQEDIVRHRLTTYFLDLFK